jgi:glycosyltransferase involved in cell wall biosynthesis
MSSRSENGREVRTAAIVPAFNEEKTVGLVVRALKGAGSLHEVIVVDDGSKDGTAEAATAAGADRVISLPENIGKGGALQRGVSATSARILLFCDADLIGLSPVHIERLLSPLKEGRMAMCAGVRERGPVLDWMIARLPRISGLRSLRRSIFESLPERFIRRFRIEIALEHFCRVNGLASEAVPMKGIGHVRKMQKVGFFKGLSAYGAMVWQIVEVYVRVRLAHKEFLGPHAS